MLRASSRAQKSTRVVVVDQSFAGIVSGKSGERDVRELRLWVVDGR